MSKLLSYLQKNMVYAATMHFHIIAYGYAMIKGLTVTVTKNIRLEIPRG